MCNSMSEKKRKMCEPNPPPSLSPSPSQSPSPSPSSSLQSQFSPSTPKISRYAPKLHRRMETDACFRCNQRGHWYYACPLNSSTINNYDSLSYPKIWCRCGHGFCEVKTVTTNKNWGKKYYACPIKRGKKCSNFVKWCDGGTIDESDLRPPLHKYPECECGAGVCRKEKGTDEGKYYFACPVRENHGSCGYWVWEDELLDNNKRIVPIQQSSQRTHVFWEGYQNGKTDYNMDNGGDLLVDHSKRIRMMDNPESPSSMVISKLPEREDESLNATPSKCVGFPEFKVADYLEDLEFANSVLWDAIKEEPFLLSQLSTPSKTCYQQSGHSFADASFVAGPCPMGWLGRLLFFYPTQSLKFPPPQPFFCCIFPSFNLIDVPKQVSIPDGPFESNQLAISSLTQHTQLSTSCDADGSRDVVSPNKSPGSERKLMSKAQRHRQVVLYAQQQLLNELVTLDHESMKVAAEATFDILNNLGVNYKEFSEHVLQFIDLASSMAEMDKSLEKFRTLDEYNKRFEEEKVRLSLIQDEFFNTETLLEASNQRRESLIKEVSHLEAMVHEKQTQLRSCELENLQLETHLGDLRRSLMDADTTLKVAAEKAEVVRQLNKERQIKQISAKTALEMAKLELKNV